MGQAEILCGQLEKLINQESECAISILLKAKEIVDRNAFVKPYNSLHALLTRKMKCSAGKAQRLKYAIRMVRRVPELTDLLLVRTLHYHQLCLVAQALQTHELENDRLRALFALLHDRTDGQTEQIIAEFLGVKAKPKMQKHTLADGTVRITIDLPPGLVAKIEGAQERVSHSLKSRDLVEFVEYCCDKILNRKEKPSSTVELTAKRKREIIREVGHCERRNHETGEVCGSRWQLEVDHVKPRWAGGTDERENLEVLCDQHNRMKYRQEARIHCH